MFNENVLFGRKFEKGLDSLKFDQTRYDKNNTFLGMIFEEIKKEDSGWKETLGLNFNDLMNYDYDHYLFLKEQLRVLKITKKAIKGPLDKALEDELKKAAIK